MHILSDLYHAEFLAVPQLARLVMARTEFGHEPAVLVKVNTLNLKYIMLHHDLRLVLFRVDNFVGYGARIPDDPEQPTTVWSFAESDEELRCLDMVTAGEEVAVFLFNELAVNVAEARMSFTVTSGLPNHILRDAVPAPYTANNQLTEAVHTVLDQRHQRRSDLTGGAASTHPGFRGTKYGRFTSPRVSQGATYRCSRGTKAHNRKRLRCG